MGGTYTFATNEEIENIMQTKDVPYKKLLSILSYKDKNIGVLHHTHIEVFLKSVGLWGDSNNNVYGVNVVKDTEARKIILHKRNMGLRHCTSRSVVGNIKKNAHLFVSSKYFYFMILVLGLRYSDINVEALSKSERNRIIKTIMSETGYSKENILEFVANESSFAHLRSDNPDITFIKFYFYMVDTKYNLVYKKHYKVKSLGIGKNVAGDVRFIVDKDIEIITRTCFHDRKYNENKSEFFKFLFLDALMKRKTNDTFSMEWMVGFISIFCNILYISGDKDMAFNYLKTPSSKYIRLRNADGESENLKVNVILRYKITALPNMLYPYHLNGMLKAIDKHALSGAMRFYYNFVVGNNHVQH